jgi:two-component system sensor histidine kinase UhpB
MGWIAYLHNQTSIFTKVLVANGMIVTVGSLLTLLTATHFLTGTAPANSVEIGLVVGGLLVSLGVNYGILRLAFQPIFTLQTTLDQVRRGDFSARVPEVGGDPNMATVTETANLVLDQLAAHRQSVAAQILRAMEEERKRIARELHDETSQSLTSILVNLESIEHQLPTVANEVAGRIRLTKEIARRSLDETRRLMFDLRPSVLDDLGLVPALRWFITQRVQPMGPAVDFSALDLPVRLSEELETALFRVLQEAMTNAVKHAKAERIWVVLTAEAGEIVGEVRDNGNGFRPDTVDRKNGPGQGLGLFGIHERATLVGGTVAIQSAPGKGTTVRVAVPYRTRGE